MYCYFKITLTNGKEIRGQAGSSTQKVPTIEWLEDWVVGRNMDRKIHLSSIGINTFEIWGEEVLGVLQISPEKFL